MPRTTAALVQGIIDIDPDVNLAPFILAANQIVTGVCSSSGYTDSGEGSQMELIERWLSAHFYTVFDREETSVRLGATSSLYQGKTEEGFRSSFYGQMAMRVDYLGNLAKLDNSTQIKRKITIELAAMGRKRNCGVLDFGIDWEDLTVVQ